MLDQRHTQHITQEYIQITRNPVKLIDMQQIFCVRRWFQTHKWNLYRGFTCQWVISLNKHVIHRAYIPKGLYRFWNSVFWEVSHVSFAFSWFKQAELICSCKKQKQNLKWGMYSFQCKWNPRMCKESVCGSETKYWLLNELIVWNHVHIYLIPLQVQRGLISQLCKFMLAFSSSCLYVCTYSYVHEWACILVYLGHVLDSSLSEAAHSFPSA